MTDENAVIVRTPITPMEMIERAASSGASVETLAQLMALQERWEASQARKAYDDAMAEARAEIPVIKKNKQVGFEAKKPGASRTDYKHEDLAEIARTVDPILAKHGLSYRFRTSSPLGQPVTVTCIMTHRMGHREEETTLQGPRDDSGNKNNLQSIGSTVTYLQRYTLKAALGLAASDDDDGMASGKRKSSAQAKRDGDWDKIATDIAGCSSPLELEEWAKLNETFISNLPAKWVEQLNEAYDKRMAELEEALVRA